MDEEAATADATNYSSFVSAASSVLVATPFVRCAIIADAINVVTFNYFIDDFDSVNLKI